MEENTAPQEIQPHKSQSPKKQNFLPLICALIFLGFAISAALVYIGMQQSVLTLNQLQNL